MAREPITKPELHQPVLDVIARVRSAHQAGGGALPLGGLVRLFVPDLSPEDAALLESRGDLILTPSAGDRGVFSNTGHPIRERRGVVTVTVPATVNGTYEAAADRCRLTFDRDHTVSGRVLFFTTRLEEVRADQRVVDVDLSGETFDQTIIHAPAMEAADAATTFDRVITTAGGEPYYTTGPQQGRGPDGVLAPGTRVRVVPGRSIGSYVLVESEAGPIGYVSESALDPAP